CQIALQPDPIKWIVFPRSVLKPFVALFRREFRLTRQDSNQLNDQSRLVFCQRHWLLQRLLGDPPDDLENILMAETDEWVGAENPIRSALGEAIIVVCSLICFLCGRHRSPLLE